MVKKWRSGEAAVRADPWAAHREYLLVAELFGNAVRAAAEGPPFDDQVGVERRGVGVRGFFVDDDVGFRRQSFETIDPGNQPSHREQRRGNDPDRVAEQTPARPINGPGDLGESGLQPVPQVLAGRGETYAAAVTLQEHDTEILLQALDLAADRAGGDGKLGGGDRHGPHTCDGLESAHGVEGRGGGLRHHSIPGRVGTRRRRRRRLRFVNSGADVPRRYVHHIRYGIGHRPGSPQARSSGK